MQPKPNILQRFLLSYRNLPAKKQYIEFFTAVLTIPVLLTVIILNVSSLRKSEEAKPTPAEVKQVIVTLPSGNDNYNVQPTPNTSAPSPTNEECKKEVGPIEIVSPKEGEEVSQNPVSITISKQDSQYCAVVWSYRINNGRWSDYDDKSIAVYDLPNGKITLSLRIKSVASGVEKLLTREFVFSGGPSITPSPTLAPTLTN